MTYNEQLNQCLTAIKQGDQTKFGELHRLTYGPLINVAKSYLIDKSFAEAVMSDTYFKIFLYADRYNPARDAMAYLWQVVKNRAFDYNRQVLRDKTVDIDDVQIVDNVDQYERADVKMDVAEALKRVGHTNALIVIWTYRDGLTQDEIGKRLGMSKSAVCQRLSKTMKKLYQYLK